MTGPLVSVIVPVHNGARFLAAALDSVAAQDYGSMEIVVVDDGSSDNSAEIAASYRVRLLQQPNRGVAEARNAGVAESSGELLAFLDQDDLWLERKVSRQVAALEADPTLGFVLTRIDILLVHDIGPLTHGDRHDERLAQLLDGGGLEALRRLREEGAVSAIGVGVNEVQICLDLMDRGDLDVLLLAGRYTLLERGAVDELLPRCVTAGVSVVIGGPFNSGILATGASAKASAPPSEQMTRSNASGSSTGPSNRNDTPQSDKTSWLPSVRRCPS